MMSRQQFTANASKENYDYTVSNIVFPTIANAKFRMTSGCDASMEKVTLKMEKLKSAQQWQIEITDIAKHGPSGFPKGAIFKGLKHALGKLVCDHEKEKSEKSVKRPVAAEEVSETEPSLTIDIQDGGAVVLSLFMPIMGFPVEFTFKLLPVACKHIDILETSLRDAEEEIQILKRNEIAELKGMEQVPSFITLRSKIACAPNGTMAWNILRV